MKNQRKSNKYTEKKVIKKKEGVPYEDFMALFFIVAFLIIDFLSYFKTYQIIAPQFLYLTILNTVIGCYIYYNPTLHSAALVSIFKKSAVLKIYLSFIILSGLSIFFAKNVSLGLISIAEIIVVFAMFLNLTILLYNRTHLIYKVAFLIGAAAFLRALLTLQDFDLAVKSTTFLDALNSEALKGNTGNINILSASLLFKIPFIFIGIINYTNWKRWFLVVALILVTVITLLINARASLLSLIIITICTVIYCFINTSIKKSLLKTLPYIILPLIISVIAVNITFKQAKLSGRYTSTTERLKQIDLNESSVNERLTFWKISTEMMKQKPLLGIGLGNYRVESIAYYPNNGTIPLHAHNDFLELAAETGILNGLLYFSLFAAILFINIKRIFGTKDIKVRNMAFLTSLLLIVYGIDAVFNFPFFRPTMQICFCLLLAFTFVNKPVTTDDKANSKIKIYLITIVVSIIPLYFTYYAYKTSHLEYMIQTDNINVEDKGVLNGDDVANFRPKTPNVFLSAESFVEYAGIYYFREKKYEKAIKFLDSAKTINAYSGRPDFYKYLIAAERNKPDSAYIYIKDAFYRNPLKERFYEIALLMAGNKRDSIEILKIYNTTFPLQKSPANWEKAVNSLQTAGYSQKGLNKFIDQGINDFPKDSIFNNKINKIAITNHIIEGQALFDLGKYDQALNAYHAGLKIDPKNVYVLQNIGFYYYNLHKIDQAIPYFTKAISSPKLDDGKTEFFLGICYLEKRDKNKACTYFNMAKNKGYQRAQSQLDINCR